jgi:hypothetical protein
MRHPRAARWEYGSLAAFKALSLVAGGGVRLGRSRLPDRALWRRRRPRVVRSSEGRVKGPGLRPAPSDERGPRDVANARGP